MKTPTGNIVRAYNRERTLCDILRAQYDTDIQIVTEAFNMNPIQVNNKVILPM